MKKDRFSLSRFLYSILTRGTPTGYELDVSNELLRSVLPQHPGEQITCITFDCFRWQTGRPQTSQGSFERKPRP